ncbi:MAG: AAA family ATPase [Solirubrobacteraceae bacterium]|nr:AAA family ATPase [Solirubrobacteraceae bacterium]
MPPSEPTSSRVVGRDRELAEFDGALRDAANGRGRLYLVDGDPGVGKTTLCEALQERALDAGARVHWGRCWEDGGAPAFWPWVQIVRAHAATLPPEQLRVVLGAGAEPLAHLVPELRQALPELAGAPATSAGTPEQHRFALFDALGQLLVAAAQQSPPLVVVLDDLHAADEPSLRALRFVARHLRTAPLLVVGTYRGAEAREKPETAELLGGVAGDGQRMSLSGLDPDAVGLLVARLTAGGVSQTRVSEIARVTEGNPLFVDEIVRLWSTGGVLTSSASAPLPDGVRQAIRRRFAPLPDPTREVLEIASVLGREFSIPALQPLTALKREQLSERLDTAVAQDVLTPGGQLGRYRFGHALMREVLYDGLPAPRRIALHRRAGEALEVIYAADPEPHLAEFAHHFLQAAPGGGARRGVEYALRAGRRALDQLAFEEAAALLRRGLEADALEPEDPHLTGELLVALGEAEIQSGARAAGRETLDRAATHAQRHGDAELLAQSALTLGNWGLSPGVIDDQLVTMLEAGLDALPDGDSELRARLIARLALALYWSDRADRRRELGEEATAMARRVGDNATLAAVLADATLATWGPDSTEEAIAASREVQKLAESVGDDERALHARSWRVSPLLELGDMPAVERQVATFAAIAHESRQPLSLWYAPLLQAIRALMRGELAQAEALDQEAAQRIGEVEDSVGVLLIAGQLWVLRREQGRLAEMRDPTAALVQAHPNIPTWRCALAVVERDAGDAAAARHHVQGIIERGLDAIPRDNVWLLAHALLAEACAFAGNPEWCGQIEERLAPYAHLHAIVPDAASIGPISRPLGLLAAAQGEFDRARDYFTDAVAQARSVDAPPLVARALIDGADALAEHDPVTAKMWAREALVIAEPLGQAGVAERARARLGRESTDAAPAEEPRVAAAPARAGNGRREATLRREGEMWAIDLEGEVVHVRHTKGMDHLAKLLASPGTEFHVLDLVGSAVVAGGRGMEPTAASVAQAGLSIGGSGDAGAMLDDAAKSAYRERITDLENDLAEAERFHDDERAARARAEMDFVVSELSAAVGLGGRDRRAASDAERARVNVTRAIRSTVKRVSDQHATLGGHLDVSVRTGLFCRYDPDPGSTIAWTVQS